MGTQGRGRPPISPASTWRSCSCPTRSCGLTEDDGAVARPCSRDGRRGHVLIASGPERRRPEAHGRGGAARRGGRAVSRRRRAARRRHRGRRGPTRRGPARRSWTRSQRRARATRGTGCRTMHGTGSRTHGPGYVRCATASCRGGARSSCISSTWTSAFAPDQLPADVRRTAMRHGWPSTAREATWPDAPWSRA